MRNKVVEQSRAGKERRATKVEELEDEGADGFGDGVDKLMTRGEDGKRNGTA